MTAPAQPAHLPCSLCDTPVPLDTDRCPECGLWRGSHRDPVTRQAVLLVAAVFAAIYVMGLVLVALAR